MSSLDAISTYSFSPTDYDFPFPDEPPSPPFIIYGLFRRAPYLAADALRAEPSGGFPSRPAYSLFFSSPFSTSIAFFESDTFDRWTGRAPFFDVDFLFNLTLSVPFFFAGEVHESLAVLKVFPPRRSL